MADVQRISIRVELRAAFADVWCAIPKVVFSRTLDGVQGNARLAKASVAEEAAAALDATDKDVSIGGAGLAAAAIERTAHCQRSIASPERILSCDRSAPPADRGGDRTPKAEVCRGRC